MVTNRWMIQSETNPNKQYEVVRIGDRFVCSCPDAVYRDRECKHCKMIREKLRDAEIEDKTDEVHFTMREVIEGHERLLKDKEQFIPLEEI